MFYIHQTACISAQQTFGITDISVLKEPVEKKLLALEPQYENIPPGILRRMGKAVRMGVAAAMQVLENNLQPDGIIIGTTNAGKEDCVKFLKQIIEYDEGLLTPINFVQSIPNALAAQIGLLTKNHGYNITHTHLGLAFEFAVIDAGMMIDENPLNGYLLGAVDDISSFNYYFEEKSDWYKKENISMGSLYNSSSSGSIAGEAATMFMVNGNQKNATAKLVAVDTLHQDDELMVKEKLNDFIQKNLPAGEKIDLLLTGENGDHRLLKYYLNCESQMPEDVTVARYKHICGEYPTATAMGLWLCCEVLQKQIVPKQLIKKNSVKTRYRNILMYNNYKFMQHSFMLVSIPN